MKLSGGHQLVRLRNGAMAVFSADYDETMHPGLGPQAEAKALCVEQLNLRERVAATAGEFVVWDVGLGAAANALAVLRATRDCLTPLRLVSFDNLATPAMFALENAPALGYLHGYETHLRTLLEQRTLTFTDGAHLVTWQFQLGDFPTWLERRSPIRRDPGSPRDPEQDVTKLLVNPACRRDHPAPPVGKAFQPGGAGDFPVARSREPGTEMSREPADWKDFPAAEVARLPRSSFGVHADSLEADSATVPPPHAILYDAFSPATNPAMWTLPLFMNLFRVLDPDRPCALTTYSRSTMLRVTLLMAGFFVGYGRASGLKEETTVAANRRELLTAPLDRTWLERARRSGSAEPMQKGVYRQSPLSSGNWELLVRHPQFLLGDPFFQPEQNRSQQG